MIFFALLAVFLGVVYYYYAFAYTYWKKRNIPQITPTYPFEDIVKIILGKASFGDSMVEAYEAFKDTGYGGIYSMWKPTLLICDPELIKQILTKDFSSFHDHGVPCDIENDPLSGNLFNIGGAQWKTLRAKLSPTFTSGKIKGMFPLIHEVVTQLKECVREESKKNDGSVEMKDLLMRYTADVIGTCAFGINCNSLKNPDAEFHHMGREMLKTTAATFLQFLTFAVFPKLKKYLTTRRLFPKTTTFFTQLMEKTVRHRKENNVVRNDFVQLLMQIADEEKDEIIFSQDLMTAQAIIFFLAGLDNVGLNIGFCIHSLAVDQELQERVYREICDVLAEHDGQISYEAVKKMDLVSRVHDEGLRLYTPLKMLMRVQTEDKYLIPGTDVVLDRDTMVMVPIGAIHQDETYYPNPKKFDPDRFMDEEKAKRHPYTYLPFGEGPRFCIASRFAKLEVRLCLAEMIRHFKFSVAPQTDLSLKLDPKSFGPSPKNDFWLKVTER